MFPLSKTNTKKHRAKKRKLEIELAIESILTVLKRENKIPEKGNTKIFEFGCKILRLKRKIEIIRSQIIKKEVIYIPLIDAELDEEFKKIRDI